MRYAQRARNPMSQPDVKPKDPALTTPPPDTASPSSSLHDPLADPLAAAPADGAQAPLAAAAKTGKETKEGDPNDGGRGPKGTEIGKKSWEGALGDFLGGKLYSAIAPHLTASKLSDYASQGWGAAIAGLADYVKTNANPTDADIAKKVAEVMKKELPDKAKALMKENGGALAQAIGGFVDENPYLVVLAALAGAVAYVATNQPLPALKQQIGLGAGKLGVNLTVKTGVLDLAKSIESAVGELKTTYAWSGAVVSASASQDKDGNRNLTAGVEYGEQVKYKDDEGKDQKFDRYKIGADGAAQLDKEGNLAGWSAGFGAKYAAGSRGQERYSLTGRFTDPTKPDEASKFTLGANYDQDQGMFGGVQAAQTLGPGAKTTLGATLGYKQKNFELSGFGEGSSDGSVKAGVKGSGKIQDKLKWTGEAGAQGTVGGGGLDVTGAKFGAGIEYGDGPLKFKAGASTTIGGPKPESSANLGFSLSF
jgi:hypothetical protein